MAGRGRHTGRHRHRHRLAGNVWQPALAATRPSSDRSPAGHPVPGLFKLHNSNRDSKNHFSAAHTRVTEPQL